MKNAQSKEGMKRSKKEKSWKWIKTVRKKEERHMKIQQDHQINPTKTKIEELKQNQQKTQMTGEQQSQKNNSQGEQRQQEEIHEEQWQTQKKRHQKSQE